MTPYKILHTIRQGHIGGGETHVQELVKHINKEKYKSYVLTFGEGDMHDKLHDLGVPSFIIPTSRPFDFRVRKQVLELSKEIQPDLIHAHGARACSNSFFISKKLGIPLIYTVHGWTFRDSMNSVRRWFRKNSEKYLSGKANLVINVSLSDFIIGKEILGLNNSMEIVNGVDAKIFNGKGDHNQKFKFGFLRNDFVVCMIARMTEQKDPLTFIRAMDHLRNDQQIKALIVGDGELLTDAKVLAHKLRLDDKIVFTGFRNDVNDILSWSDAYCLPSLWEGMPIGILEAMSSGCAVIGTNVTGTKEVINEETGIIVEPGDYHGIGRAISVLKKKPEFKSYLERNAAIHIKRHYTIRRMVKRISTQYRKYLKRETE